VPGDSVHLGTAEISVRDMKGKRIGHVGIKLG
jgi:hypothetical protein